VHHIVHTGKIAPQRLTEGVSLARNTVVQISQYAGGEVRLL